MHTKTRHIMVELPNNKPADVSYYCSDAAMKETEKSIFTKLHIQLDDCICIVKVRKSVCKDASELEKIVHNKVITTKGHLCEEA